MADNTIINPGSGGDAIATDDIGGVKFQRVKVTHGADGSATDVSSASPLPVDTELPAAAALSDSTANPTAPMVGAAGMVFDQYAGTWKRVKSSARADGSDGTDSVAVGPQLYRSGVWEQQRAVGGDAQDATGMAAAGPMLYNDSSFDRQRGNTEGTLLASAARTATAAAPIQTNYNARGIRVWMKVTAKSAATTFYVVLHSARPTSGGASYTDAEYTAFVPTFAAGVNELCILTAYPGAVGVAVAGAVSGQSAASMPVGRSWWMQCVPSDANSVTYEVTYSYIL